MPQFTIVIPVKTGGVYLKQAVDSVLAQTIKDFELVILGDAVTAKSDLKFLQSYNDSRIKIDFSNTELNMLENWDRIRSIQKHEFLTILGYDDILFPTYLERMQELIAKHPKASLYQVGFDFINSVGQYAPSKFSLPEKTTQVELLKKILHNDLFIMATGYMMRSADYDRMGGVPTKYANLLYADFELWLQMTGLSYLAFDPSIQFAFRLHESTTNKSGEDMLLNAFEKFSNYLLTIANTAEKKSLLREQGYSFLSFHANAILFRLLRRNPGTTEVSVSDVANKFKELVSSWGLDYATFTQARSIKKAFFINSIPFFKYIFYYYKKLNPGAGTVRKVWMDASGYNSGVVNTPQVSICIPAYNRVDYLKRLLDSIAIQHFKAFEVIVTDDSTTADVGNFLQSAKYVFPLIYVKNELPKGTPANWMEGMKYAKANWIKIMHDDDWFVDELSLEAFMKLAKEPFSIIFAGYNAVYEKDGKVIDKAITASAFNKICNDPYQLFASNLIGPPSVVLFRKNIQELYDTNLKWLVDLEGYVRMIKKYKAAYIPLPVVNMSYNETQVTNDCFRNPDVEIKEALIYYQKHGDAVYRSWISYDGWWRLLRNLSIRSLADLQLYAGELEIPAFLQSMLKFQQRIPLSLLKIGALSKIAMTISFIFKD